MQFSRFARDCLFILSICLSQVASTPSWYGLPQGKGGFDPDDAAVWTTSGGIIGHTAPNATNVTEYLGIRFAQPPVGELRFAPPAKLKETKGITRADKFGNDCPVGPGVLPPGLSERLRNFLDASQLDGDVVGEDCLFLNVWTANSNHGRGWRSWWSWWNKKDDLKPVLVFLYGGGFNTGGTNTTLYNGQYWAAHQDVVFVTLNYRVNVFGFPGAPNVEQNAGVLDQRLALEWVRDNIRAFGGDPARITLFGQSAGSASVDIYNYAWTKDPIIAGSIKESGEIGGFGTHTLQTAAAHWYNASEALGCGGESAGADAVLACMRSDKVTMEDLLGIAQSRQAAGNAVGSLFYPTADEKTVFSNYTDLLLNKKFIQKPAVVGNNNYEAGLFLIANFPGLTPQNAGIFGDQVFTCPASTSAQGYASVVPTWRYYYGAMFPNIQIPSVNLSQAYHSAELSILFQTSEDTSKVAPTHTEVEFSYYIQGAWAAFARNPETGLKDFGWPTYDPTTQSVVLLGIDQATTASYGRASDIDALCGPYPFAGPGSV